MTFQIQFMSKFKTNLIYSPKLTQRYEMIGRLNWKAKKIVLDLFAHDGDNCSCFDRKQKIRDWKDLNRHIMSKAVSCWLMFIQILNKYPKRQKTCICYTVECRNRNAFGFRTDQSCSVIKSFGFWKRLKSEPYSSNVQILAF